MQEFDLNKEIVALSMRIIFNAVCCKEIQAQEEQLKQMYELSQRPYTTREKSEITDEMQRDFWRYINHPEQSGSHQS